MFDVAEIGSTLAKEDYKARMPDLRARLLEAQFHLRRKDVPVLIAVAGDDRIGCEELIDRLNEWLDARYLDTQVFEEETEEERAEDVDAEDRHRDPREGGNGETDRLPGCRPERAARSDEDEGGPHPRGSS